MIPADISLIKDEASLRECYKKPMSQATDKVLDHLDVHLSNFGVVTICVLSSQANDGADISPRGDPTGLKEVLDDQHVLLPDRIGNNRLDN